MLKKTLLYLWVLPTSVVGLLFLPDACFRGRARWLDGVLELQSPIIRFCLFHFTMLKGGASAMTLGHVVIGADQGCLDRSREHERVHVRQCERWGPMFIPAYLLASAWVHARGGRAYLDNPFEREAYER